MSVKASKEWDLNTTKRKPKVLFTKYLRCIWGNWQNEKNDNEKELKIS